MKNGNFAMKNGDFAMKNGDFPSNVWVYKRVMATKVLMIV